MLRAHVLAGGGAVGDQPVDGRFQYGAVRAHTHRHGNDRRIRRDPSHRVAGLR
jgi:hypothetical protein